MGLGPLVCSECLVVGKLTTEDDPRYGVEVSYGRSYWHCPKCGSPELDGHLWEYPLDQQTKI